MEHKTKKIVIGATLFFITLFLAGCIPSGGGPSGPANSGEFVKGAVVRGFPPVPVIEGAQVIESYGDGQSMQYGASFISDKGLSGVVEYYRGVLPQTGWESNVYQNSQDNMFFDIKNPKFQGTIIVNKAANREKIAIMVSVEPR